MFGIGTGLRKTAGGGVDADSDVTDKTIFQAGAKQLGRDERAVSVFSSDGQHGVLGVGGTVKSGQVGGVGAQRVDLGEQVLLEEELANVLDRRGAEACAVGDVGLLENEG